MVVMSLGHAILKSNKSWLEGFEPELRLLLPPSSSGVIIFSDHEGCFHASSIRSNLVIADACACLCACGLSGCKAEAGPALGMNLRLWYCCAVRASAAIDAFALRWVTWVSITSASPATTSIRLLGVRLNRQGFAQNMHVAKPFACACACICVRVQGVSGECTSANFAVACICLARSRSVDSYCSAARSLSAYVCLPSIDPLFALFKFLPLFLFCVPPPFSLSRRRGACA